MTRFISVAVVIPCYQVKKHIAGVLRAIGPECSHIFVVDDCCKEGSGLYVESLQLDPRIKVLYHSQNRGVGGAVMTGYRAALEAGAEIIVKIDGDGQMDPALIPKFIAPIARGEADYTKGNRFYTLYNVRHMPKVRLFGNSVLSFITKFSTGYWSIFDPTNGYTAIHASALRQLELKNISERYFFESDMLSNLGGIRAVVRDIPMEAIYGDEKSHLRIKTVVGEFLFKHVREFLKRITYSYFLRDFNIVSLNMVFGFLFMTFGGVFGLIAWWGSIKTGMPATTGTVMVATLPIILGFQLLLSWISYDIANEPSIPLQRVMND